MLRYNNLFLWTSKYSESKQNFSIRNISQQCWNKRRNQDLAALDLHLYTRSLKSWNNDEVWPTAIGSLGSKNLNPINSQSVFYLSIHTRWNLNPTNKNKSKNFEDRFKIVQIWRPNYWNAAWNINLIRNSWWHTLNQINTLLVLSYLRRCLSFFFFKLYFSSFTF